MADSSNAEVEEVEVGVGGLVRTRRIGSVSLGVADVLEAKCDYA